MRRRRPIDNWAHIRPGDILSFDTKSPNCPTHAYVHNVTVRDDGKRVLRVNNHPDVVEHDSYRMRLEERGLTVRMQADGGPLALPDLGADEYDPVRSWWSAKATFDVHGKQPTSFEIEAYEPARLRARAHWNVWRTTELTDDTDLLLEVWGDKVEPLPGRWTYTERRGWRRFNPVTRRLEEFPVEDVVYPNIEAYSPQNPHAFDGLDAHSGMVAKLNEVLGWIHDNRHDLDDPGQPARTLPVGLDQTLPVGLDQTRSPQGRRQAR